MKLPSRSAAADPASLPRPPQGISWTRIPQDWTDKIAVLVGTGPSLAQTPPPDPAPDLAIVAVKEALWRLGERATCGFSADHNWPTHRFRELEALTAPECWLAVDEGHHRALPRGPALRYLVKQNGRDLSRDPWRVSLGGTSGYAALNFAVLRGARRIVLLGYDYAHAPDGRHHADPEMNPWYREANVRYWGGWARDFSEAAPVLAGMGVRVLNSTPGSRIDAFQWMTLDDALHYLRGMGPTRN